MNEATRTHLRRKYEAQMQVTPIGPGELVRSYDFEDREDCYVEGLVLEIDEEGFDCPRYAIEVQRCVIDGVPISPVPAKRVYPPVNGTPRFLGGVCNGVVRVEDL